MPRTSYEIETSPSKHNLERLNTYFKIHLWGSNGIYQLSSEDNKQVIDIILLSFDTILTFSIYS